MPSWLAGEAVGGSLGMGERSGPRLRGAEDKMQSDRGCVDFAREEDKEDFDLTSIKLLREHVDTTARIVPHRV